MSTRYRFGDSEYAHFITFSVVNWIDALSRPLYKDVVVESLKYCPKRKGAEIARMYYFEQPAINKRFK